MTLPQCSYMETSPVHPDLSVFFFSGDESFQAHSKYDLVLSIAKLADELGFKAIWTPERHYHRFGGLYPAPAVLAAAIAVRTEHIEIRAGSVVLPLHEAFEVAEQWAVVDNLSHGRVGVSFAPGFHPRDFVHCPEAFPIRRKVLEERMASFRAIWRGELQHHSLDDGTTVELRLHPAPVQLEIPIWLTAAGSERTFAEAGACGANILTALMGQDLAELGHKIAVYRHARADAGLDPSQGIITLMLHAYAGRDEDEVIAVAKPALKTYLETHAEFAAPLLAQQNVDVDSLDAAAKLALLGRAFNKYRRWRSLIGTEDYCSEMLSRCAAEGVDEVACLVDFGLPAAEVEASLRRISRLSAERRTDALDAGACAT
jgi:natural product biosynthesis luciferase-like monooxygenase protein